eukprot:374570-Alexandrium_andersonii.AAC.1
MASGRHVVGRPEALVASWFCESQRSLAAAVAASCATRSQRVGTCPRRLATHDVWDLVRNNAEPLRR